MGVQNFSFLTRVLPGFKVNGSKIKIIHEPSHFYQELVNRSQQSSNRIVMSALYLGTGGKENKLIEAVNENLIRNENLRVKMLLDWCRGTRLVNNQSSSTLLMKLKSSANSRSQIYFYHTPYLRGYIKKMLPSKWNEIIGLQHCKVYIFDNSLIISGANLSNDYFTNRQDRYILIEDCSNLADFYEGLIDTIGKISLVLSKDGQFKTMPEFSSHPYNGELQQYIKESYKHVSNFLTTEKERNTVDLDSFDTIVFPSVEMGQIGIKQDSLITSEILRSGSSNGTFHFATGYFNLTETYMKDVIDNSSSDFNILMAHPRANGFLGAKWPLSGIPHAYTLIARNFFKSLILKKSDKRINLFEYQKPGWTFHAKGLWFSSNNVWNNLPCLTMIGSPNFGYRSVDKDLETQVTILTKNKNLKEQLSLERDKLYEMGSVVTKETFKDPERRVPKWVKTVVGLARKFF